MSRWTIASRSAAVDAILSRAPVLPVLAIERIDDALPLARALIDNGLPVLEITLRSAIAVQAIALLVRELPEAVIGAGTVLDAHQLGQVVAAGALRGLGDTRTPMVINLIAHWFVGLPIGATLGLGYGWGVTGLWIGLCAGLVAAAVLLIGVWTRRMRTWNPRA